MSGWQPIETAPKDYWELVDLSILITFPSGRTDRMRVTDCYWNSDVQHWCDSGDGDPERGWSQADGPRICKATHWMRTPDDPPS